MTVSKGTASKPSTAAALLPQRQLWQQCNMLAQRLTDCLRLGLQADRSSTLSAARDARRQAADLEAKQAAATLAARAAAGADTASGSGKSISPGLDSSRLNSPGQKDSPGRNSPVRTDSPGRRSAFVAPRHSSSAAASMHPPRPGRCAWPVSWLNTRPACCDFCHI